MERHTAMLIALLCTGAEAVQLFYWVKPGEKNIGDLHIYFQDCVFVSG